MSGSRPFVRQLGAQPGVQLNPLADTTEGAVPDNSDQVFAMLGRFSRGRIDRPFKANRSNLLAKTGKAEPIRSSLLNEAKLQAYEAVNKGAYEGVLMRLTTPAAVKKFATVDLSGATSAFAVATTLTGATYSVALMHHNCHNDGIKLAVHAELTTVAGIAQVNKILTLRVIDADGVTVLHEFTGSVDPDSRDDFGESNYLPDVCVKLTDACEVVVSTGFAGVITTSDAYGRGTDNKDKWATSSVLACFVEGTTAYQAADYDRCIEALRNTTDGFGYIISGGTQSLSLLGKLASFAAEINVPMNLDYPGTFAPDAVLALDASLGLDTHYVRKFWAPLESDDPLNGGRAVYGTSGMHIGYSCARNALVNAKGFAPKHRPIANKAYPIMRTKIRQLYKPSDQELSDLAKAQINPVIHSVFNGGSAYVFTDCLTAAKTQVSYKKLATVAEMSASLDNWVSMQAKELLMLPMEEFIDQMERFLGTLLEGAQTSGWLKPAKNLANNAAFAFEVVPSEIRPADLAFINYYPSFDGVARQAVIQQTLVH